MFLNLVCKCEICIVRYGADQFKNILEPFAGGLLNYEETLFL